MRTSRVILLVIIVSLVGFGLLGLNSQKVGYDAEFDTKLIPIDKPKIGGVLIPIQNSKQYLPLNYIFDDKSDYWLKATAGEIFFKMSFTSKIQRGERRTSFLETVLTREMETYFWPSPLLENILVKGTATLIVKKLPPDIKREETQTYKPLLTPDLFIINSQITHEKEARFTQFTVQPGDIWWRHNEENTTFQIIDGRWVGLVYSHSSIVALNYDGPHRAFLVVPKGFKEKINFKAKKIGNFILFAVGGKRVGRGYPPMTYSN